MPYKVVTVDELLSMDLTSLKKDGKMIWKKVSQEHPKEGDSIILLTGEKAEVYGVCVKNERNAIELRTMEFDNNCKPDHVSWALDPDDRWLKLPFTRKEIEEEIQKMNTNRKTA